MNIFLCGDRGMKREVRKAPNRKEWWMDCGGGGGGLKVIFKPRTGTLLLTSQALKHRLVGEVARMQPRFSCQVSDPDEHVRLFPPKTTFAACRSLGGTFSSGCVAAQLVNTPSLDLQTRISSNCP